MIGMNRANSKNRAIYGLAWTLLTLEKNFCTISLHLIGVFPILGIVKGGGRNGERRSNDGQKQNLC